MAKKAKAAAPRAPLTRERVLRAALALADAGGVESLSMRRLGQELGVEAMSLYKHVASKDAILDGVIDLVVSEIDLPAESDDWRAGMRRRAVSARRAFARHPWATSVMESRTSPGPAALRYYDAVIGCLRRGGFSIAMAAHAFAVLDAFIYGFAMQEKSLPFQGPQETHDVAEAMLQHFPVADYPNLAEMIVDHALKPGYDFAHEFDYGLDLILDALERARDTPPQPR